MESLPKKYQSHQFSILLIEFSLGHLTLFKSTSHTTFKAPYIPNNMKKAHYDGSTRKKKIIFEVLESSITQEGWTPVTYRRN